MYKLCRALLCALIVLAVLQTTNGGKFGSRGGGRHSYPSSHSGLSGSGSRNTGGLSGGHGYPSSGGSHGYPSGGLSGGSHGYPSSGGSHGYPSGGLSGGSRYPPSGNNHGYPSGGGLSGTGSGKSGYPSSGSGLSGSQNHGYPNRGNTGSNVHHTTVINHNYHYSPPQQIRYSAPGHTPVSYPVYHGTPPTYVYQYKNSDSKYGTLLAGLALLNLGTLGASVYAASKAGSHSSYKPQPGEFCKFGVKKDNGDYEETKIDCYLISSFIYQEESKTPHATGATNSTIVTTTVTNVTVVNMTNGVPDVQTTTLPPNILYQMLPNGTLVPVNVTLPNSAVNATANNTSSDGNVSTMTVTTTTTNTTVTNALDVKGKPIDVTPGMQCFVIRHSPTNNMKKTVPCGLLQSYADQSIKKNSATKNIPTFTALCAIAAFAFY